MCKRLLIAIILSSQLLFAPQAKADSMKQFLLSCAYGVLAGTMVGAATLALTENPEDNYNNIARGASLGLYSGILLGVYVVYFVPEEGSKKALQTEISNPKLALSPQFLQDSRTGSLKWDGMMLNLNLGTF